MSKRLETHIEAHDLHDKFQSAYRPYHSTETALLRVQSDITNALDQGCSVALVMLDLSAAFDTIDHSLLLQRLETMFGINGNALQWFSSYLSGRNQSVSINGDLSEPRLLDFGVPQGSVLGPKLYCLYTKPVSDIFQKKKMDYHCYADDSQMYVFIKPKDEWSGKQTSIESCVNDVSLWMEQNMLKLNDSKTEVMFFAPKSRRHAIKGLNLSVGCHTITPNASVKNLGVFWDTFFTMEVQVRAVSRACNYHLRNIGRIRNYVTEDACRTLVNALVTSRLDYGNALLYGVPENILSQLQRVQNTAARIISRTPKRSHITPVLKALHWLPVARRIEYKILLYTFKALSGTAPQYICDLLQPYIPARSLRSDSQMLLCVPTLKTVMYGKRCFKNSAPVLWNQLPYDIKASLTVCTFKKKLKTHLFRNSFS